MKYKTISQDAHYSTEMQGISMYLLHFFQEHNFATQIVSGYGNPIVLASYGRDPSLPICLLYGHYDIQVADQEEGWRHDPFSLHIAQERIFGRGVADNKGQFLIHVLSICELIKEGDLGYNVIVVLEGNEETGSPDFKRFLEDYREYLRADFCLISDSTLVGDVPCIDAGYRGSLQLRLVVHTAHTDVHSGLYGGVHPNAIHELTDLINKLHDDQGRVSIPYFYYDVDPVSVDTLVRNKKLPFDQEVLLQETGAKSLHLSKNTDIYTQIGLSPCIEVTGISGGYTQGHKAAIPGYASAHLNVRIVAHQSPSTVYNAIKQWLITQTPAYVDAQLFLDQSIDPIKVSLDTPYAQRAIQVLQSLTHQKVYPLYGGGSLPVVSYMMEVFSLPLVLIPLANQDCHAHGVDENFRLDLIERGFAFSRGFFAKKQ